MIEKKTHIKSTRILGKYKNVFKKSKQTEKKFHIKDTRILGKNQNRLKNTYTLPVFQKSIEKIKTDFKKTTHKLYQQKLVYNNFLHLNTFKPKTTKTMMGEI